MPCRRVPLRKRAELSRYAAGDLGGWTRWGGWSDGSSQAGESIGNFGEEFRFALCAGESLKVLDFE